MSKGKNTVIREISPKTLIPEVSAVVDATVNVMQGDLLILAAGLLALPVAEADAADLLGVMSMTLVDGKIPSPYVTEVDASRAADVLNGPIYGNTNSCVLKAGDSLTPGVVVYLNPGVQALSGVSNGVQAAGTKPIGVYSGKAITAAAGGSAIEVLIGARAFGDILKF